MAHSLCCPIPLGPTPHAGHCLPAPSLYPLNVEAYVLVAVLAGDRVEIPHLHGTSIPVGYCGSQTLRQGSRCSTATSPGVLGASAATAVGLPQLEHAAAPSWHLAPLQAPHLL